MGQKSWHLQNCDMFADLPEDEIKRVESQSLARNFPRGSTVYLPSDFADGVFLLAKGRVKICHVTPQGKQSILSFVNPGELFGELAVLGENQRSDYAETMEKSLIVLISREVIDQLFTRRPEISLAMTKLIGLRRRRVEMRLKHLLFHSNRERLIHLILELADQFGVESNEGTTIGIRLSHQELGNLIGSTRESVTILLGELQNEGLIKISRRKICVTNVEQIAAVVNIESNSDKKISSRTANQPSLGFK